MEKLINNEHLSNIKFAADCAIKEPDSIYSQEFFMLLDETFGSKGDYESPTQAVAVAWLINRVNELEQRAEAAEESGVMGTHFIDFEPSVSWDGVGMPPVGCECEAYDGDAWYPAVVVGHYDGFAFAWNYDHRITFTVNEIDSHNFRPIRTEEERKREEAVAALKALKPQLVGQLAGILYDQIAAGKIPHVILK